MADLTKLPQAAPGCLPAGLDQHGKDAFEVRFGTATLEASTTGSVSHPTNNDEALPDKSGTYSKCLKQKDPGLVDLSAFAKFRAALAAPANGAAFEVAGMMGAGRPLNGPLGSYALTLSGADSQAFGPPAVPAAPSVSSKEYATELVELYWASLLRDVPFSQYETNATAIAAANELTRLKAHYAGPLHHGAVTPKLLFRGGFTDPAKTFFDQQFGPYISQFAIQPTALGALPIDQKITTYAPGMDYMTTLPEWNLIQNGSNPTAPLITDSQRHYMYNGRALGSFTRVDQLYQAYFTAYLAMQTLGVPANKTSPYKTFKNQQPFGTFGPPDIAATLAAVARAALNAVWYQKWIIHLRHRPESGGGLVHLKLTPGSPVTDAQVDPIVLNSEALKLSHLRYGSYLLSQAFPEGSPAHPAYPTGHGTVAGACITVLKFFFEGSTKFSSLSGPPLIPSACGTMLEPYTGLDQADMTVNGELHKIAHNISFGHGIHAGIHWRSDTDYSLLLGEAVALAYLQDQAFTYEENFAVQLQKLDGATATITNF